MNASRASPENAGELTAIANAAKAYWGYPESWLTRWADALTITPDYICAHPTYVARLNGSIVGFCSVAIDGEAAVLDHLWVLPQSMDVGVGRFLFQQAEEIARQGGASSLNIESDPHAEQFYIHMGATRTGQLAAAMDDKERFLPLLKKNLTRSDA
jgi:GNAT superfamily N-acetyltransferase